VLNLFCYTGSFSVYAAAGGALDVTSIDLSATYLAWAARNLARNGFTGPAWPLVKADVSTALTDAKRHGKTWDLIIADPPTFSNSRSAPGDFDINRDWPRLVADCLSVLAPEGHLYFSSNSRRLRWDSSLVEADYEADCEDISEASIPPDFRDRRIRRTWRISKS
jgi:23S rRNA (cytosine1962-C5)-methyltransferase